MIVLRKMTENEYADWMKWSISDYAKELAATGKYSEAEAKEEAGESFHSYLADGLSTPNHYLLVAENDNGIPVGMIWYETVNPSARAFIADFVVYDEYRRMGYGSAILAEVERILKLNAVPRIELHVFEHNTAAIKLYEKCGFTPVKVDDSLYMEKQIID